MFSIIVPFPIATRSSTVINLYSPNELAKMMGYKVGSGRVDFEKRRIETNERNLSYMKDYVVKKLSAADGCCTAEELMKQVEKLCVKYLPFQD